jgi:drug/metabolite transporter (DMT)-like permease
MALHQPSGKWQLGAGLALLTVFCWGALPIVLMLLLRQMDAWTASWFRFLVAAGILGLYLKAKGKFPKLKGLTRTALLLLFLATLGLAGNYLTYLQSLAFISPGTAQIMIQIAPLALLASSVIIFKEPFSKNQKAGVLILTIGLGLFFNHRIITIATGEDSSVVGLLLIVIASLTWALYAAAQKQLLTVFTAQGLLFYIYFGSAILFTPIARLQPFLDIDALGWGLLIFASLNTVIAYGAFSEALSHLEASRVSAILALTPLASLTCVAIASTLWPQTVPSENLSLISYIGAIFVVVGSALAALGKVRFKWTRSLNS